MLRFFRLAVTNVKSELAFGAALAKSSLLTALAENVPTPPRWLLACFCLSPVARAATMCEVPKEAQLAASRAKIPDDGQSKDLDPLLVPGNTNVVTTGQQERGEHCIHPIIHRPQDSAHFLAAAAAIDLALHPASDTPTSAVSAHDSFILFSWAGYGRRPAIPSTRLLPFHYLGSLQRSLRFIIA